MIEGMEIGFNKTRVGLIEFASGAVLEFDFATYDTSQEVRDHIMNSARSGGATYTNKALELARTQLFTESGGMRPTSEVINRLTIVLTDGRSSLPSDTIIEADKLKEISTIISVGIGTGVDFEELHDIASDDSLVFEVDSFESLSEYLDSISDAVCKTPITVYPDVLIETRVEGEGYKFFEIATNSTSITVNVDAEDEECDGGTVTVYVSLTPKPSEFDFCYKAERQGNKTIRIDLSDHPAGTKVYIAIKGCAPEGVEIEFTFSFVPGLFCDDGTEVQADESCPEDETEKEIDDEREGWGEVVGPSFNSRACDEKTFKVDPGRVRLRR